MTTIPTHTTFDAAALRRAHSDRDAGALLALYADDATIEVADAQNTPSRPQRVEGREAIRAHLEETFARDMTHEVETVAVGDGVLGYSVRCAYPGGARVLCAATARLRDGRIASQLGVQAWDEG